MDDDPRGLVDDEQVLVLERDPERKLLGLERRWRGRRRLEAQLLPAREPVALRPRLAVDEGRALREQSLSRRPRADLRERAQIAIEPLPGRFCRNDDPGQ
jgi:hypothetical protein